MKYLFKYTLLIIFISNSVSLFAQHRGGWGHQNGELILVTMTQKLDMNDNQVAAVKQILIEQKAEILALRKDGEKVDKRDQIREIKANFEAKIKAELDKEQLLVFEKWQQLRADKADKFKGRKGDRCGVDDKFETKAEIKATLLKMRVELDRAISKKDKRKIKALRKVMKAAKADKNTFFKSFKINRQKPTNNEMEAQKLHWDNKYGEAWDEVLALTKKYNEEITNLFEEHEFEIQRKPKTCCTMDMEDDKVCFTREEVKTICTKEQLEACFPKGKTKVCCTKEEYEACCPTKGEKGKTNDCSKRKGRKYKFGRKGDMKARFILMNPKVDGQNLKVNDVLKEVSTVKISPNPAINNAKISYTVKNEGLVKIDLVDESGNPVENLLNEFKPVGIYEFDLILKGQKSKFYFVTIQDEQGINSEKLLIQNR